MHSTRPYRTSLTTPLRRAYQHVTLAMIVGSIGVMGMACGVRTAPMDAAAHHVAEAVDDAAHASKDPDAASEAEGEESPQAPPMGTPSGTLRAEAWPTPRKDARWRALEDGKGVFVDQDQKGVRTFVFSSVTDSMPATGLRIDLPSTLDQDAVPQTIVVSASPTPMHVSRDAYPSIATLLQVLGVVELDAAPGDSVYIAFDDVERISLIQLQVWGGDDAEHVGMGRVRIVHPDDDAQRRATRNYALQPLDEDTLPEDANVLGTSDRITLPHKTPTSTQE